MSGAMQSSLITSTDAKVRQKFTYKNDEVDRWRSFSEEVNKGSRWEGDCDDLAMTTIDLLSKAGADPKHLGRGLVSSEGGKRIDHMIAFAKDDKGQLWVVGDTFGSAYHVDAMQHKCIYANVISEGITKWYEINSIAELKALFN